MEVVVGRANDNFYVVGDYSVAMAKQGTCLSLRIEDIKGIKGSLQPMPFNLLPRIIVKAYKDRDTAVLEDVIDKGIYVPYYLSGNKLYVTSGAGGSMVFTLDKLPYSIMHKGKGKVTYTVYGDKTERKISNNCIFNVKGVKDMAKKEKKTKVTEAEVTDTKELMSDIFAEELEADVKVMEESIANLSEEELLELFYADDDIEELSKEDGASIETDIDVQTGKTKAVVEETVADEEIVVEVKKQEKKEKVVAEVEEVETKAKKERVVKKVARTGVSATKKKKANVETETQMFAQDTEEVKQKAPQVFVQFADKEYSVGGMQKAAPEGTDTIYYKLYDKMYFVGGGKSTGNAEMFAVKDAEYDVKGIKIYFEINGKQYSVADILANIGTYTESLNVWVKPQETKVYYIRDNGLTESSNI